MSDVLAGPPIRGARAVLFDKDGTLFDFQATWGLFTRRVVDALAEGDAALADRLAEVAGFDRASARFRPGSPIVSGSVGEIARVWMRLLPPERLTGLEGKLVAQSVALGSTPGALLPAAPDLPGLLGRLRAGGLSLGVATHDGEAAARAQLSAVGALDAFAFVAGYDSGYAPKPDAAMLLAFAARVGVAAAEVVVVGDSLHDLGMGAAGGAIARVAVLTGVADAALLGPHATHVAASIEALPELLGLDA